MGYQPEDGVLEPQSDNPSVFGPAGSMISNLEDSRVWAETLATGSPFSPETQAERLKSNPLEEGPPYDRYALGIGETQGWWGHNGEGFGFSAAVFHDPTSGATVVVFMNAAETA